MSPPLTSHISPDIFLHIPTNLSLPSSSSAAATAAAFVSRVTIIFFVTGNPGLIAYYHPFLSILATSPTLLTETERYASVIVAGFSLGGFEIGDSSSCSGCGDGDEDGSDGGERGSVRVRVKDTGVGLGASDGDSGGSGDGGGVRGLQFPVGNGKEGKRYGDGDGDGEVGLKGEGKSDKIYGLQEQIDLTERRLGALVRRVGDGVSQGQGTDQDRNGSGSGSGRVREDDKSESNSKDVSRREVDVVLLGHSVGAYIVLELIRRHAQRQISQYDGSDAEAAFNIKGAILLTPTIVNIAQSPSGRVLTPLVTYVPGFAALVAGMARGLVGVLGREWLRGVVRRVTGMPDHDRDGDGDGVRREGEGKGGWAEISALDATVAFLRSKKCVRQALEMAKEEMNTITEDTWGEEVWGVESAAVAGVGAGCGAGGTGAGIDRDDKNGKARRPQNLVFYFAKTDHWVADQTREELLRLRGRLEGKGENWKPKMVVDQEDGLVHGWCIKQSELVAGKVGTWISEILRDGDDGDNGRRR